MIHATPRPSAHPGPSLRDTGLHDFFVDLVRLAPAPDRKRELFAASITLILLGLAIGVLQPGPGAMTVMGVVVVGHLAIRWTVGVLRTWRR